MRFVVFASVVVVVVAVSSACAAPRVYLPAPPPADAPLVERERAFETLRPIGSRAAGVVAPLGSPWKSRSYVVLGGGARVEDPRDLVAVVGPGPVKDAAERAEALESEAVVWNGAGWGVLGVGAAVSFGSLGVLTVIAPTALEDPAPIEFYVALGGIVGGWVVMMSALIPTFVGSMRQGDADVEKDTAFILYGDALCRRLDLPQATGFAANGDDGDDHADGDAPGRLR